MEKKEKIRSKNIGQVFTPQYLVEEMLDYAGYKNTAIIEKHIIDNSCGDGAFLQVAVKRYCEEALRAGKNGREIKTHLECYIHGIDTDKEAYENCKANLEKVANRYKIKNVAWDIHNQDALAVKTYDGKIDYVVGNPPYVRVHNLQETYDEVKQYRFANGGMTDLYLAFFELGFNMLNPSGKLCYITPSSWLSSVAARNMRNHVMEKRNIISLVDLGHYQPFPHVTAYTIISLFSNDKQSDRFDYYTFNSETRQRNHVANLSLQDSCIDGILYLSDKEHLDTLRSIKTSTPPRLVTVKNGFATLADNIFIGEDVPESTITIKALKASTGKKYKCLFPYDEKGKPLPPDKIFSEKQVANYLQAHKDELLKGRKEHPAWYQFGRTQALQDVYKDKLSINTLLRTEKDLKIEYVPKGEGIYSGLYAITHDGIPLEDIKQILETPQFADYIKLLKKYKSGGYYTYNTTGVEQYINWYISYKSDNKYANKSTFLGQYFEFV